MTPREKERLDYLSAGLALGNLSPEEAQELQQLIQEAPEPGSDLATLSQIQADLAILSPKVEPPLSLRGRIMQQALARSGPDPTGIAKPHAAPIAARLTRRYWLCGTLAACLLGIIASNWQLRRELAIARANLLNASKTPAQLTLPNVKGSPELWVTTGLALPGNYLSGLREVIHDHSQSLQNETGPADYASSSLAEVLAHFEQGQYPVDVGLNLDELKASLLGGSLCQFKETEGFRFSYQLTPETRASIYQLKLVPNESFPAAEHLPIYITSRDGTSMVLWQDQTFLYAIVAELPLSNLKNLSQQI